MRLIEVTLFQSQCTLKQSAIDAAGIASTANDVGHLLIFNSCTFKPLIEEASGGPTVL